MRQEGLLFCGKLPGFIILYYFRQERDLRFSKAIKFLIDTLSYAGFQLDYFCSLLKAVQSPFPV